MSDYVHTGRRAKIFTEHRSIESRLMFGAFYLLFLMRAIATRLVPWRRNVADTDAGHLRRRESVFSEASSAASVLIGSSFMGL